MPATEVSANNPKSGGADDLDRLFGNDDELDHIFRDLSPQRTAPTKANASNLSRDVGLGIDEEIEVERKARAPRVKLDETRLLSQSGIPKLRRIAGSKLKFKGKGHEYKDAQKLLSLYQLWLDDLFPKAKFLDALNMVEKLGHKRRVQMMRMEWINEGKPKQPVEDDNLYNEPQIEPREPSRQSTRIAPIFERQTTETLKTPATRNSNNDEDDIYRATPGTAKESSGLAASLFGGDSGNSNSNSNSIFGPKKPAEPVDDGPPEDDLDALFAEEDFLSGPSASKAVPTHPTQHDNFDDDEEAMAEMGGMDEMW